MSPSTRRLLFLLFFISGFCGLVYQVVWTRMAFACFGIITPVLSVVISVFMLGLSVGAWAGGRAIAPLVRKTRLSALMVYAFAEMMIGLGAFAVPKLFAMGERALLAMGQTDSASYLLLSALMLALAILPWCLFMGTTFPLVMAFVRELDSGNKQSFSFLYLANVLGAMCGTSLTAVVLVEVLGFRHTLWVAAAGNFTIAAISVGLDWSQRKSAALPAPRPAHASELVGEAPARDSKGWLTKWILFTTGFAAMAMEVVWSRSFTSVLGNEVYSFALVVFAYLGATSLGSLLYRRNLRTNALRSTAELISYLGIAAFLPVVANDPRFVSPGLTTHPTSGVIVLASICPFCAVLGYLTPGLVDQYAAGAPNDAGRAYAINVLGCILGPLFASYVLLPQIGERYALVVLGLPLLVFFLLFRNDLPRNQRTISALAAGSVLTFSIFFSSSFEDHVLKAAGHAEVRRDYAASVTSYGEARDKHLLVNGIGMTTLTPITKFMVHLPLAFHNDRPESVLIICFGMGTTYRSALSWDVETTVVELVPSVKDAFGFYHADARRISSNPKGRIVVDDGRRFLQRTREKYDVIVVDPPPPPAAAGSSLLYATEFYELAKQRLKPHGILQAWFPGEVGLPTAQAVLRSVDLSFPFVRCFVSIEGRGVHALASLEPIETRSGEELAARLPAAAGADLLEWAPDRGLADYLGQVVSQEKSIKRLLDPDPTIQITDDKPYNEYFLLRRWHLLPR